MEQQSARLAVFFALIAWFCISLNDVVMKVLSDKLPLHEIVLIRSIGGIIFSLIILKFEGGWKLLKIDRKLLHFSRCILMVAANLFYFTALAILPLAEAAALFFVAPLFISILSSMLLNESIGARRISAVITGFLGIIIVMRPLSSVENNIHLATYFLPLLAALSYALAQIIVRKLGTFSKASVMAVYIHITFFAVSLLFWLFIGDGKYSNASSNPSLVFLLRPWSWPLITDWPLLIFLGTLAGAVGYCVTRAYMLAEASFVAPFEYIAVPLATFWGWFIFGDLPDFWATVGILIIMFSGLYIYSRERKTS